MSPVNRRRQRRTGWTRRVKVSRVLLGCFLLWAAHRSILSSLQVTQLHLGQIPATTLPHPRHDDGDTAARKIVYSSVRGDRSGAVLHDMLMCRAYAFRNNFTYMGGCRSVGGKAVQRRMQTHHELVNGLGLEKLFPFVCPPKPPKKPSGWAAWVEGLVSSSEKSTSDDSSTNDGVIIPDSAYRDADSSLFTSEWLKHLQEEELSPLMQRYNNCRNNAVPNLKVALHVRRGDVTPCRYPQRYLPNAHYRRVLHHYFSSMSNDEKRPIEVVIHSQSPSFENLTLLQQDLAKDFGNGQAQVRLHMDAGLNQTWIDLMTANVLVLSRSSFSFAPALLNLHPVNDQVILYTPFWHKSLSHWHVVPDWLMNQTQEEVAALNSTQCPAE